MTLCTKKKKLIGLNYYLGENYKQEGYILL